MLFSQGTFVGGCFELNHFITKDNIDLCRGHIQIRDDCRVSVQYDNLIEAFNPSNQLWEIMIWGPREAYELLEIEIPDNFSGSRFEDSTSFAVDPLRMLTGDEVLEILTKLFNGLT